MRIVLSVWLTALLLVTSLALASQAAASVAYIDGGEVWVSTDDGARKVRLSAGQGNWTEVAQSDQGYIVGVQRDSGKSSIYASFTVWDPAGKIFKFGSLSGDVGGNNVYPLGLDITPDGGLLVYGFSNSVFGIPVGTLTTGTYLKTTSDPTTMVPIKVAASTSGSPAKWPSLVGARIVSTNNNGKVYVQDPASIGSNTFTEWLDLAGTGFDSYRADFSATGNRLAVEFVPTTSSAVTKIALIQTTGLGADGTFPACYLPTQGDISQASFSQNGGLITWSDQRGVVISDVGTITATENCAFGGSPRVISATGAEPSYGPFSVPASGVLPSQLPTIKLGSSVKLASALKSGLKVTVTSPLAGKAKVTLSIKPSRVGKRGKKAITLATGTASLAANVATKIKVKFTKSGKKLKKKLKGRQATLTVAVGKAVQAKTVKLK